VTFRESSRWRAFTWLDLGAWPQDLGEPLSAKPRGNVLPRGRSMTFDARWWAVTMASLYGQCG
jgi:hypothetical protein